MVAKSFELVGHRGAPRLFPANTLRSFQAAADLGCTMVECDIRRSRDGALMLAHDPHVRSSDGKEWRIAEHTQAELTALDLGAGEGVPTFDALVVWLQTSNLNVMADMKCEGDGIEAQVAAALAVLPRHQKCVSGAGRESRARFRAADPDLPLLMTISRGDAAARPDPDLSRLFLDWPSLDADGGSWEHAIVTAERVAAMYAVGGRVFAWTVDDLETMRRLVACGVDGITSNRSDLFATLLAES